MDEVAGDVKRRKKSGKEKKKKKKLRGNTNVVEKPVETAVVATEEDKAETSEALATNKLAAANPVDISENIVLRKLLRGPRYFDPPGSGWRTCYNCGEGGHTAVNCSSVKRKKSCFVCGSLEHTGKQCKKGRDCFICKSGGHLAKNCPEKYKGGSQISKLCLKCGDLYHDMFSCKNDYSLDDLKEIQCYICQSFGHLCCAAFGNASPREPSCCSCGQLGHTVLECKSLGGTPTRVGPFSSCFKCGKEGHLARECTSSTQVQKRILDESTSSREIQKGNKETVGTRSMPSDYRRSKKRKNGQYEGGTFSTPSNLKRRGGWITEGPGDLQPGYTLVPGYGSPVTPIYNRNAQVPGWGPPLIPTFNRFPIIPSFNGNPIYTPLDGHALRRAHELQFGPSASNVSPIFDLNIYSTSIYGNFNSYGTRSNYYYW